MNKVITISRQYGSGGREIGSKLAEKLGVERICGGGIRECGKQGDQQSSVFHCDGDEFLRQSGARFFSSFP